MLADSCHPSCFLETPAVLRTELSSHVPHGRAQGRSWTEPTGVDIFFLMWMLGDQECGYIFKSYPFPKKSSQFLPTSDYKDNISPEKRLN